MSEEKQCRPKISVILPVYNAEKYLRPCLDSIRDQTLREIEILCVDDGSSDASPQILAEYAQKDSRMRVICQENAGAGAARNSGLKAASGTYLSFLDADDFFEPRMLALAYEKAEAEQSDFVVFRSDQYYTEEDRYRGMRWSVKTEQLPQKSPFSRKDIRGNVFRAFIGWAWDKLYRREFVQKHQLFFQEQRTSNDFFFVFTGIVLAERISVADQVLVHQRRDAKDSLSKTRENSWFCYYDALLALRDRMKQEGIFGELERDFINYAVHASLWNLNTLAEPTRTKLAGKLKEEWSEELGIRGKHIRYFYDRKEYMRFLAALRRRKQKSGSPQENSENGSRERRDDTESICDHTGI